MSNIKILWVDDEIELLQPHILFLEKRGYVINTATNADDALDMMEREKYDLLFLDEHMPGLSGLDSLALFKKIAPNMPIVMVTKSEEEDIMDRAVGARIADYLIKPVNPNQILLSIKKNLHGIELVSSETTTNYQADYHSLAGLVNSAKSWNDWVEIYRQFTDWNLHLTDVNSPDMLQMHDMQQAAANSAFAKYIRREYEKWFSDGERAQGVPLTSPRLLRERVFPVIDGGEKVLLVLIDNLRYDQWCILREILAPYWRVEQQDIYCSILPTVTHYARNALFAGLMPMEIESLLNDLWVNENDPEEKNMYEPELLAYNIQRLGRKYQFAYYKGANLYNTPFKDNDFSPLQRNDLTVIVYNFVDMMSHARVDATMVRNLASDAHGYLSLTESWFKHSDLFQFLQRIREIPVRLIITTDHGSIQVKKPIRVVGDRETSTNLRYKLGRNLNYTPKEVFESKNPELLHLPKLNVSSRYIFATGTDFFAYPNNYNYYVNRYRDSFQHGGVSMEEMLVPIATLKPIL